MRSGSWHCKQSDIGALLDWTHGELIGAKGVSGASRPTSESLEVRSQVIPGWAVVVAILLFPIGLLALAAKTQLVMFVRVVPDPAGGCTMSVNGNASEGLQKRMAVVYNQLAAQ